LYYDAEVKVKIINEIGQLIATNIPTTVMQRTKGIQHFSLQTNSLATGIYFCELSIDGHSEVKKFAVQH
jgi:hypothetical protein